MNGDLHIIALFHAELSKNTNDHNESGKLSHNVKMFLEIQSRS